MTTATMTEKIDSRETGDATAQAIAGIRRDLEDTYDGIGAANVNVLLKAYDAALSLIEQQAARIEVLEQELAKATEFDQAWIADDPEIYIEDPYEGSDYYDFVEPFTPTKMLTGKRLPSQWVVIERTADDNDEPHWFANEDEAKAFCAARSSLSTESDNG